jgi:hypothetical protein
VDKRRRLPIAQIGQLTFVLTPISEYESENARAGRYICLIAVDGQDKNSKYLCMNRRHFLGFFLLSELVRLVLLLDRIQPNAYSDLVRVGSEGCVLGDILQDYLIQYDVEHCVGVLALDELG